MTPKDAAYKTVYETLERYDNLAKRYLPEAMNDLTRRRIKDAQAALELLHRPEAAPPKQDS